MNHKDETVFSHYTDIAEAKQTDVRKMQAEVALSIFRAIGRTLGKVFKRLRHSDVKQVLDKT